MLRPHLARAAAAILGGPLLRLQRELLLACAAQGGGSGADLHLRANHGTGKSIAAYLALLHAASSEPFARTDGSSGSASGGGTSTSAAPPPPPAASPYPASLRAILLVKGREPSQAAAYRLATLCGEGGLNVRAFVGGGAVREDLAALRSGTLHVAVGTPGKLFDLLERGALRLDAVRMIALDDVDACLPSACSAEEADATLHQLITLLRAAPPAAVRLMVDCGGSGSQGSALASRALRSEPPPVLLGDAPPASRLGLPVPAPCSRLFAARVARAAQLVPRVAEVLTTLRPSRALVLCGGGQRNALALAVALRGLGVAGAGALPLNGGDPEDWEALAAAVADWRTGGGVCVATRGALRAAGTAGMLDGELECELLLMMNDVAAKDLEGLPLRGGAAVHFFAPNDEAAEWGRGLEALPLDVSAVGCLLAQ